MNENRPFLPYPLPSPNGEGATLCMLKIIASRNISSFKAPLGVWGRRNKRIDI